ncbi:MAG: alpha/beta hydrolase [Gammaproteobacteria bacterium]|nr:alpha/beta hydrolase [Gammaproteobacteria bacterium]
MAEAVSYTEGELALATGKIKYLEQGSGPPVVVLHHSWGSPGWLPFHDRLAEGHRVIVPDMPGWGGSERPAWARDPRDIAIITTRLLSRLGLVNVKLVGLGFGGYVAAELATMNPSRLAGLVLVGAAGLQPKDDEIMDQMMLSHRKYIEESFRDAETYHDYVGEEPPDDIRQLWDLSREMTARVTWKPYMFNRRLEPLLCDLDVPTLIVWGEKDKVVPFECAKQFEAAIPNARVEVVAGAGHVVELEEPDQLAALVGSV